MKIILRPIILSLFFVKFLYSQVVFEPVNSDIYTFLSRVSQKGIIKYDDQIKPLPRSYLAGKLQEISSQKAHLTQLEKEELKFYRSELGVEINNLNKNKKLVKTSVFTHDNYGRYRIFSFENSYFYISANPVLGYEIGSKNHSKITHRWNGLGFYGYIGKNIGFSFNFRDNREEGINIDKDKKFTPVTGISIAKSGNNYIEYSSINVSISTNWSWGNFTIGKDNLEWGYGESGKLVLSNKAPSFPFIRLDISPVSWLHFNYFHGWLNSNVEDTTLRYSSFVKGQERSIFIDKFIASHTLTLTPIKGLDISLGESIIYADKLKYAYLIPIMFFRAADHYLSDNTNNFGGNSQFFFGLSSRNHIKNTHLYGSLYIDEIRTSELFNPAKQRNQIGFSLGGSITDLPLENLTWTLEYTKIYPFAFVHYIPTLTYQNNSYTLGHWIGHNGDLIYSSLNYRFIRGLQATLWGEYIRKGSEGTPVQQWNTQVPQPPFLFGLRTNYTHIGLDVKYEIIHDLFARAKFQYTKIEKEQENLSFNTESFSEFSFAVYYGL